MKEQLDLVSNLIDRNNTRIKEELQKYLVLLSKEKPEVRLVRKKMNETIMELSDNDIEIKDEIELLREKFL